MGHEEMRQSENTERQRWGSNWKEDCAIRRISLLTTALGLMVREPSRVGELGGKGKQEVSSVQLLRAGGMGHHRAVASGLVKGRQLLVSNRRAAGNDVQIVILTSGR